MFPCYDSRAPDYRLAFEGGLSETDELEFLATLVRLIAAAFARDLDAGCAIAQGWVDDYRGGSREGRR